MLNKYIKILIVSIFVILIAVQAGKSFVLDEIDFPIVSHATSQTFKPSYYRGEVLPSQQDKSPLHVGTYHPTLYINALATFIRVFGYNEASVRFFGAICALISVYLLILILRQLTKKNETAEVLLMGLFLLNPYTIANATLPDIDSTILPIVLLLFIYFSLKFLLKNKEINNKIILILGALFALALWAKLTTPLILPLFLVSLSFISTKNYKKSILLTLKVALSGILLFVITYFVYCRLLNLSTTFTYRFLVESFTKGTSTDGPLIGALHNLSNFKYFVFWPTLPLVGLIGVATLGVLGNSDNSKESQVKKLLTLIAICVTLFYIALISPFGGFFKYPFPVFGIFILTIIFYYESQLKDIRINKIFIPLGLFLGFILEKLAWGDAMFINGKPFRFLAPLLLLMVVCYLLIKLKSHKIAPALFILLIFFAIGFQFSISRIQATSSYSTKYLYGQKGLDETAAYLRSNTKPDEIIWSMKDVGYYVNNKYYESYLYYFDPSLKTHLISLLHGSKVRYYVVSTGIGQDNIDYYKDVKQILDTNAVKEKQFGNFIIYKSKE